MSDDDWLADAQPAANRQRSRQSAPAHADRPASGGYQQAEAQRPQGPQLLQRPSDAEDFSRGCVLDRPPPKTMKQKEAEYAAARARIFGNKGAGPQQGGGRGATAQATAGRGRVDRVGGGKAAGRGVQSNGYGGNGGNGGGGGGGGSGRRPPKDEYAGDPDYDRNPAKFGARLVPSDDDMDYSRQPVSRNSRPADDDQDYNRQPVSRNSQPYYPEDDNDYNRDSIPVNVSRYQPPTYENEFPALGR